MQNPDWYRFAVYIGEQDALSLVWAVWAYPLTLHAHILCSNALNVLYMFMIWAKAGKGRQFCTISENLRIVEEVTETSEQADQPGTHGSKS